MRKKLGTIKVHSNIDLITNSSTEIFCAVEGKDLETVQEAIDDILDGFGCTCLSNEYGISVDEYERWNDEKNDYEIVEGVFQISYEYGYKPCKMVKEKIEELFNMVPIEEE